jgi:hypothetical protein
LADDKNQHQHRDGGEDNKKNKHGTHGRELSPSA